MHNIFRLLFICWLSSFEFASKFVNSQKEPTNFGNINPTQKDINEIKMFRENQPRSCDFYSKSYVELGPEFSVLYVYHCFFLKLFLIPFEVSREIWNLSLKFIMDLDHNKTENYITMDSGYQFHKESDIYCELAAEEKWKSVPLDKCIRTILLLCEYYPFKLDTLLENIQNRCKNLECTTSYGLVTTNPNIE
ncbi:hypothetical protein LCGC14_1803170, partial [marine sediment metagenome]